VVIAGLIAFTISVAGELVMVPAEPVTVTVNTEPLSLMAVEGVV
jgi:hypothetical protein